MTLLKSHLKKHQTWLLIVAAFILGVLYVYGARQQLAQVNIDPQQIDQSAYLEEAKVLRESNYTAVTGRNRMPVYLYLLSLFYTPELSEEAYFIRGKWVNLVLSVLILLFFFLIFRKYLPLFTAVNLLLITAFTVFIFKAAYVQADLLFYFFNFLAFLLLNKMLLQPNWRTGLAAGLVLGIAHLTKASIIPGLALFVVLALGQVIVKRWRRVQENGRWPTVQLGNLILVILSFLITVGPYIRTSKIQFGHYFYNVNSTFYIWYDSWDEVEAGTKAFGDREGWPEMPAEDIPSAAKYVRQHSLGEMGQRLWEGFLAVLSNVLYSYGYFKYFLMMALLLLAYTMLNGRRTRQIIKTHPFVVLFNLLYFPGYLLLYSWYAPIATGNRFPLAQFVPFIFLAAFAIYRLYEKQLFVPLTRGSTQTVNLGLLFNSAVFGILLIDITLILAGRITSIFGGY